MSVIRRGLEILREEGVKALIVKALLYVLGYVLGSAIGYVLSPFIVKNSRIPLAILIASTMPWILHFLFKPLEYLLSLLRLRVR